jgi:hypothetical protein
MTKLRLLPTLALSAALLLPASAAFAQDEAPDASPDAAASMTTDDPRLAELEALVPPALAGLTLGENLQLATGEELRAVMSEGEAAVLDEMLTANGRSWSDYAAATTFVPITGSDVVVIQAHRVAGIDASQTIDAWLEILAMGLGEADVAEGSIAGRAVTLVTDKSRPEVPLLHMFPAGDVVWMVVAVDEAFVEETMEAVGADAEEAGEEAKATE